MLGVLPAAYAEGTVKKTQSVELFHQPAPTGHFSAKRPVPYCSVESIWILSPLSGSEVTQINFHSLIKEVGHGLNKSWKESVW